MELGLKILAKCLTLVNNAEHRQSPKLMRHDGSKSNHAGVRATFCQKHRDDVIDWIIFSAGSWDRLYTQLNMVMDVKTQKVFAPRRFDFEGVCFG